MAVNIIKTMDLNFKDDKFWFVLKSASDDNNITKIYLKKQ